MVAGAVVCWSIVFFGLTSLLGLFVVGWARRRRTRALAVFLATGSVLGGWLADRRGRLPVMRGGYLLTVPGLLLLVAASGPVMVHAVVLGLVVSPLPSERAG